MSPGSIVAPGAIPSNAKAWTGMKMTHPINLTRSSRHFRIQGDGGAVKRQSATVEGRVVFSSDSKMANFAKKDEPAQPRRLVMITHPCHPRLWPMPSRPDCLDMHFGANLAATAHLEQLVGGNAHRLRKTIVPQRLAAVVAGGER